MWKKQSNQIETLKEDLPIIVLKKSSSFKQALQPLIYLLELITGVSAFGSPGPFKKWVLVLYRLTMISLVMYSRINVAKVELLNLETLLGTNNNKSRTIGPYIHIYNSFIYYSVIPLIFFLLSFTQRLNTLWKGFKNIEDNLDLDWYFFKKCALVIFTVGLLILLLDIATILFECHNFILWVNPSKDSISNILFKFTKYLTWSTSTFILVFFMSLTLCIRCLLIFLKQRIDDQLMTIDPNVEPDRLINAVRNWRSQHLMVLQLVKMINDSFGLLSLFFISFGVLRFMLYIYFAVVSHTNLESVNIYFSWLTFINDLIHTFLVVYLPSTLRVKADDVKMSLLRLSALTNHSPDIMENVAVWKELGLAVKQSGRDNISMTAAGLFVLDHSIFPGLLGVALTYIIIVYDLK